MIKAKIIGVFQGTRQVYMIISNKKIFPPDFAGEYDNVSLIRATDELEAWQKGKEIADEYNERIKAQRQADRDKAKQEKGKPNNC